MQHPGENPEQHAGQRRPQQRRRSCRKGLPPDPAQQDQRRKGAHRNGCHHRPHDAPAVENRLHQEKQDHEHGIAQAQQRPAALSPAHRQHDHRENCHGENQPRYPVVVEHRIIGLGIFRLIHADHNGHALLCHHVQGSGHIVGDADRLPLLRARQDLHREHLDAHLPVRLQRVRLQLLAVHSFHIAPDIVEAVVVDHSKRIDLIPLDHQNARHGDQHQPQANQLFPGQLNFLHLNRLLTAVHCLTAALFILPRPGKVRRQLRVKNMKRPRDFSLSLCFGSVLMPPC